jgi:isoleucyl-tRNA synthetase
MSKHKGNVVDPFVTVDEFGADPLRWYMVSTSNPWLPTKFDVAGLKEVIRKYFDTLRNTYAFFALYANIDNVLDKAEAAGQTVEAYLESKAGEPTRFDRWIISRFNSLARDVAEDFDGYEITRPVRAMQNFVIEELSNWYVRNNRRRYWAKGDDPSKMRAYLTLYRVLEGVCRLTAPVAPFLSELIWLELTGPNREKHGIGLSVHMAGFPKADASLIDGDLEETMGLTEKIVRLGRAARARKNLKVRQPLARLSVKLPNWVSFERLEEYLPIVRDELNIKQVASADDLDRYVTYTAKLNFKNAGPKLGAFVKKAAELVAELASEAVKAFAENGRLELTDEGRKYVLDANDVDVLRDEEAGYAVESDGPVTVALSTELTEELIAEGFAREIVNKIQNMRKSSGFEVTDRITVRVASSSRLTSAAKGYEEFIRRETLADSITFTENGQLENGTEWNINGEKSAIAVSKV